MSDIIYKNATAFLQKRFPAAVVRSNELYLSSEMSGETIQTWLMIAQDPDMGVKQRVIAFSNLGENSEVKILAIARNAINFFTKLDSELWVGFDDAERTSHPINTAQMIFAPKIILYTEELCISCQAVIDIFSSVNIFVDIVIESKMFKSLFISYGGTDEAIAIKINTYLKGKGITTWFFPDDALPGQKLHRVMHEGVNNHDRVLLLCSKKSLSRPGVLNEIERVFEREAREGGSEILIPIALDKFVFSNWVPSRPDLAAQIRSRVITKIDVSEIESEHVQIQLNKIVSSLSKVNI
jgi:TIR domain